MSLKLMGTVLLRIHPFLVNFRRALQFVWESGPRLASASIALRVVQGLLPLVTLWLIKLMVDAVAEGLRSPNGGFALEHATKLLIVMGGAGLLSALCSTLSTLVSRMQSQIVTDHMHAILHAKSVEVDLEYYENSRYYDMLHQAQQEAPYRPTAILNSLLQIGQDIVSLLAMVGVLWWFHWAVIPVLLIAALPDFLVRVRHSNQFYAWERDRTPFERKAWYLNWMLTRDTHAKEIRLFNLGPRFRQWFQEVRATLRKERLSLEQRWAFADLWAKAIGVLGVFGVYWFVVDGTLQGALTMGDLVMYFQAVQRGAGYLESLGDSLSRLYESSLFLTSLKEFLNVKSRLAVSATPRQVPRPVLQGLTFDHVRFRYPAEDRLVIANLHLAIRPGEHIAIVGENGAGKTTLVKLLCRLYDPVEGRITIDGIDLREFDITDLRSSISVIFQDFVKYQMTARDNIGLGVVSSPPSLTQITEAARKAGVNEVIERLPQGYETMLGKWFEGGQELSVGEWQKVALARAFLRNSQILILDEPTSAMDAKAEAELFERFHELARGRMAILISHRLSTVKMVDHIYVVAGGHVVESGTHDELMLCNGLYAKLFQTQAQRYQ